MGIREYFEKQSKEKDLKLQDLELEIEGRKKKELKFDVEKELTGEDWRRMEEELRLVENELEFNVDSIGRYLELAMNMKILFPERFEEIQLDWQMIKGKVGEHLNDFKRRGEEDYWGELPYFMVYLKVLFPDKVAELEFDKKWDGLKQNLEKNRNSEKWYMFGVHAMQLKILYPNKNKTKELELDSSVWEKIKEEMDSNRSDKNWRAFIQMVEVLKILFSEKFKEIGLTDNDWLEMKKEVRRDPIIFLFPRGTGQDRPAWIAETAASLKIAAADEVVIEDDKFEVVMDAGDEKGFKQMKKERPVRKNF